MKLTKPTIVELGNATESIQFISPLKIQHNAPDMDQTNPVFSTGAAYSIDE
jgi:hypothetical protein